MEEERYRLRYSENPVFLWLKNEGYRADSNFGTIYFAGGDSYAGTTPYKRTVFEMQLMVLYLNPVCSSFPIFTLLYCFTKAL